MLQGYCPLQCPLCPYRTPGAYDCKASCIGRKKCTGGGSLLEDSGFTLGYIDWPVLSSYLGAVKSVFGIMSWWVSIDLSDHQQGSGFMTWLQLQPSLICQLKDVEAVFGTLLHYV